MLTFNQLEQYALGAGFTGSSADTISAIAEAESGGDPYAYNANDPGGSYGVLQENQAAHGDAAFGAYGDPANAFQQAFDISQGGTNFSPWSTYNSGAYTQFMPAGSNSTSNQGCGLASGNCNLFDWLPSWLQPPKTPGSTAPNANTLTQGLPASIGSFFTFLTSGNGVERIGVVIIGLILLTIGGVMLAKGRTEHA